MKIFKNIYFEIEKMTTDGFSFCITPSFVFNKSKYNGFDIYSLNIGVFVWLVKIEYNLYQ